MFTQYMKNKQSMKNVKSKFFIKKINCMKSQLMDVIKVLVDLVFMEYYI